MKEKGPRQTVCNEPKDDPKNPYCGGKLKKITTLEPQMARQVDKSKEVLRCQVCGTLYTEESPYAVSRR